MGWQVRWMIGVWMVTGMAACSTADPSEDGGGSTGAAGGDGMATGTTANLPQDTDDDDDDDDDDDPDDDDDDDDAPSTGEPGSESDGDGTTGGAPEGPLDCDALCEPYEACDEGAFLTCLSNCEDIVPPLAAFDDGCGAASAAYFECRFTQSCEDVTAWLDDTLETDPCADLLDTYVTTCLDVAPESCDAYCDTVVACFELPPTQESSDGCQFTCLLYEAYAALDGTAACDAAAGAFIECIGGAECQDMTPVGCEDEETDFGESCGLPNRER